MSPRFRNRPNGRPRTSLGLVFFRRSSSCSSCARRHRQLFVPCHLRVVQRLSDDGGRVAPAEILHLDPGTLLGMGQWQVTIDDALSDRVPVIRTGHVTDALAGGEDWFLAEHHDGRVIERHAGQLSGDALLFDPQEGVTTDEVAFVEADRKAESRLVRVVLAVDVGAPQAVPLLQPERVEGTTAERGYAERLTRLPQRVPQP